MARLNKKEINYIKKLCINGYEYIEIIDKFASKYKRRLYISIINKIKSEVPPPNKKQSISFEQGKL